MHHSAICVRDIESSLRFYREGLGLEVLMDREFEGDWPALFAESSKRLRSVFLGDPAVAESGIVELVAFEADATDPLAEPPLSPTSGFFLLSFFVDVDATLHRLHALGFDDRPRRITVPGLQGDVSMATVRDPDGVLVELVGA